MPIEYTYVEDQMIRGNTGPWNDGTIKAYQDGYNQIWITNDDVIFTESVNDLIKIVDQHKDRDISIWGPSTDGIASSNPAYNIPDKNNEIHLTDEIIDLTNNHNTMVNGFFHGFTKKFYETFKRDDSYIYDPDPKYNWGGNEATIQYRAWSMGGKSKVVRGAWFHHRKIRGWIQHTKKISWYLKK